MEIATWFKLRNAPTIRREPNIPPDERNADWVKRILAMKPMMNIGNRNKRGESSHKNGTSSNPMPKG